MLDENVVHVGFQWLEVLAMLGLSRLDSLPKIAETKVRLAGMAAREWNKKLVVVIVR